MCGSPPEFPVVEDFLGVHVPEDFFALLLREECYFLREGQVVEVGVHVTKNTCGFIVSLLLAGYLYRFGG